MSEYFNYLAHVAHCDLMSDFPVAQLSMHFHGKMVLALQLNYIIRNFT